MIFLIVLATLMGDFYLLISWGEGDRNHPQLIREGGKKNGLGESIDFPPIIYVAKFLSKSRLNF